MATPLVAAYRITLNYTVAGLAHKWRGYCKPNAVGAQPWSLITFNSLFVDTWVASIQALWSQLCNFAFTTDVAPATAQLEQNLGLLWVPLDFTLLTGSGTNTPPATLAQQYTAVVRDTAFRKMRVVLLETAMPYLGHSSSGVGLGTLSDNTTQAWSGAITSAAYPFQWQISRGGNYILRAGAIAGVTFDQNRKLKRARHVE